MEIKLHSFNSACRLSDIGFYQFGSVATKFIVFTRLMLVAVVIIVVASTFTVNAEEPVKFPSFDDANAKPLLVIGTIWSGKYLPAFAECQKPGVICIDPPPFWFELKVNTVVHGDLEASSLAVATTSHYGMEDFVWYFENEQMLVLVLTDGTVFKMPRYARASVTADKAGVPHLLVLDNSPISWLPCSISTLKKAVDPKSFSDEILYSAKDVEDLDFSSEKLANFVKVPGGWSPKYAIAVKDLSDHLKAIAPSAAQMECRPEQRK